MARLRKDKQERREEALRPDPHLGYDRDHLGMYLMERGAWAIAEGQFRRAIWLNPFEPGFKVHLAWCLARQGRHRAARAWLQRARAQAPEHPLCRQVEECLRSVPQKSAATASTPPRTR